MKISTMLRAAVMTAAFASVQATAAVIPVSLQVTSAGILTGAKNVNVGGTLYDVTFADGNCASAFSSCQQSRFAFSNSAAAMIAAQALIDQVFVDSPLGQFDSKTDKILGCTNSLVCESYIPYALTPNGSSFSFRFAVNASSSNTNRVDTVGLGSTGRNTNLSTNTFANFAVFSLSPPVVTDVPEPSSIALLALAATGLGFARRRKAKA